MNNKEYKEEKKKQVMEKITPICEVFGITDYDYDIEGGKERLVINGQAIGCASNSISATVEELIGYIFITRYCRNRYLGHFSTQVKNRIKEYWIKESH